VTIFHPLQNRALDFIRQYGLITSGDHVLVAVSGGPDSVTLLHVLLSLKISLKWSRLTILHFDHHLRGEASWKDKEFVESLAGRLHLPFICGSEDVQAYQKKHSISLEMAARECRHRFFQEALKKYKAQKTALGHTANDQAEEVLLRLFRGTGPGGLAGMFPKVLQSRLIRPLLFATRLEILKYLQENDLSYREDFSNQELFCQRNVLRLKVFPLLEEYFHPRVVETLYRHTQLALEEESFWNHEVQSCWSSLCKEETKDRKVLHIPSLLSLHSALQRRLFRFAIEKLQGNLLRIHAVHAEDIYQLVRQATSGKTIQLPQGLRVTKEGENLIFSKYSLPSLSSFHWILPTPGRYRFPHPVEPDSNRSLEIHLYIEDFSSDHPKEKPGASAHTAWLDAQKIHWPLIVRSRQVGDRFQPLGFHGIKKIQDFFVDAKVPRSYRDQIPILCDQEKICWIAGYRLDDRVKITPQTKQVLIVEIR
jgi:tRNA(Ile)-lysidine synthase